MTARAARALTNRCRPFCPLFSDRTVIAKQKILFFPSIDVLHRQRCCRRRHSRCGSCWHYPPGCSTPRGSSPSLPRPRGTPRSVREGFQFKLHGARFFFLATVGAVPRPDAQGQAPVHREDTQPLPPCYAVTVNINRDEDAGRHRPYIPRRPACVAREGAYGNRAREGERRVWGEGSRVVMGVSHAKFVEGCPVAKSSGSLGFEDSAICKEGAHRPL